MEIPYIGITGFTNPEEVATALAVFPNHAKHKLMVGVLATHKSIRGIPMKPKWANQTPDSESIAHIFPDDERAINLVHFSTEEGQESSVLADMLKIHEIAGPNLDGFQLNLAWPKIWLLDEYRMAVGDDYRLVLQIGKKAVEAVGGTPQGIVEMLYHYLGTIDDVLLDPSGGFGKPFDTGQARLFLTAIAKQGWNLGLGVAGGLGPDSLDLVKLLAIEFPALSIDAQGRLRDEDNHLDLNKVREYILKSLAIFAD